MNDGLFRFNQLESHINLAFCRQLEYFYRKSVSLYGDAKLHSHLSVVFL